MTAAAWLLCEARSATISPKARTGRCRSAALAMAGPTTSANSPGLWLPIHHDPRERLDRCQLDVLTTGARGVRIQPTATKAFVQACTVRLGRDDNGAISGAEACPEVLAHRLQEGCVGLIELHDVLRRAQLLPDRHGCCIAAAARHQPVEVVQPDAGSSMPEPHDRQPARAHPSPDGHAAYPE
jgi:hypothetical protein